MTWSIRLEERGASTRALLDQTPDWAAYMLGDLDPPYRQHARFYLAARAGIDRAALLIYAPGEFTVVVSCGEADGVAALLAGINDVPARTSLTLPLEHRPLFERFYRGDGWERLRRMALAAPALRPLPAARPVARLTLSDLPAIRRLLDARDYFAPFTPTMLEHGVYCGVWEDDGHQRLIAVGGTHVIAPSSGIAAIGNVYTAPAYRRQGLAGAVTGAVAAALFHDGYRRAILNVHLDNAGAIRIYERLGFVPVCDFWEIETATRR